MAHHDRAADAGRSEPTGRSSRSADFRVVYRAPSGDLELSSADVPSANGDAHLHHRLAFRGGRSGSVAVARRSDGAVLFTSSFRPAADRRLIELPRGLVEAVDEAAPDVLVAAGVRELLEETGFAASAARLLGVTIVDSAVYPLRVGIVLCEITGEIPLGVRDGEVDDILWIPRDELDALIVAGVIVDGLSLMALAVLRADERTTG